MKHKKSSILFGLLRLVRPLSVPMTFAVLLGTIGHAAAVLLTLFACYAAGAALGLKTGLGLFLTLMMVSAILRGFFRYGEQELNHYIAFRLLALIRDKLFGAMRRLAPAKLESRDKGDLIALMTRDTELLEVFYAHTVSPVLIALLHTILWTAFLFSFHAGAALFALLSYLLVGVVLPLVISKRHGKEAAVFLKQNADLSSFLLESLRSITECIQFGSGKKRLALMKEKTEELSRTEEAMKKKGGQNAAVSIALLHVLYLAFFAILIAAYAASQISFFAVFLLLATYMSSFGPVLALSALGSGLQSTLAAGDRVLSLLEEEPETEEISGKKDIVFRGADAEDLWFSYGGEEILRGLTLHVKEHEMIGIVGKSGSGKSTLMKLMMRFWDRTGGSLRISDEDIREINTSSLRSAEAYMTQETHLFRDTIGNNLRIAKEDASEEELNRACRAASLDSLIEALPKGYDTEIAELGESLSGGEKQRIGLARAFLSDAPFLLLDEPTGNLDSLNEDVILQSLQREREKRTILISSHRASTLAFASSLLSVENGRES